MAYDKNNLWDLTPTAYDGVQHVWMYRSADTMATVRAAGYISNANDMGMKRNDPVYVIDTTTPKTWLTSVAGITAGAADLYDGVDLSATNT